LLPIRKKCASHFRREAVDENKQFKGIKHGYLIDPLSDKAIEIWDCHGGSLEITPTVPLRKFKLLFQK